jgi:transcriptional repressor NrdR
VRAIRAACHKRPVDLEQINMTVEDIVDQLEAQYGTEIPAARGRGLMQRLATIDKVAYVRFASGTRSLRRLRVHGRTPRLVKPKQP